MDRHRFYADPDPTFYFMPIKIRILAQVLHLLENLIFLLLFTAVTLHCIIYFTLYYLSHRRPWCNNFLYCRQYTKIPKKE